jgi:hypothetical protein
MAVFTAGWLLTPHSEKYQLSRSIGNSDERIPDAP